MDIAVFLIPAFGLGFMAGRLQEPTGDGTMRGPDGVSRGTGAVPSEPEVQGWIGPVIGEDAPGPVIRGPLEEEKEEKSPPAEK